MTLLLLFATSFGSLFGLMVLLARPRGGSEREAERMIALVQTERADHRRVPLRERASTSLVATSMKVRTRLGMAENETLRRRLQQAGLRGGSAVHMFFSAQAIGIFAGGMAGSFFPVSPVFWALAGAVVGYMAPDVWLTRRASKRRERMRRSVPDAVDLLVICVEAGLGLDQALRRVRDDLSVSHPDLNEEFDRLNLEVMAGTPRLEAWRRLAERTKVEELRTLAAILSETDRFGTPIAKALSGFSEELRLRRRQHAEEAAAKTKIKIIFPLVLCIFPCIFIVLLAPALLSISRGVNGLGQ